jgi:hypothetical protein
MPHRIVFFLLVLMLGAATWAGAQPDHDMGGGFQDKLLEVKRNQLGPAIGVNQPTVDKLLAIDQRYKPMRRQLTQGMKNDMRRLQQLMGQPQPPEQEVKAVLTDMKRKRMEMLTLQQRKDDEETAILTPMQQARYIMYLMSLIREARNVKRGQEGHGTVGSPGGMGGPGGMGVPTFRPREIPVSRPPQ